MRRSSNTRPPQTLSPAWCGCDWQTPSTALKVNDAATRHRCPAHASLWPMPVSTGCECPEVLVPKRPTRPHVELCGRSSAVYILYRSPILDAASILQHRPSRARSAASGPGRESGRVGSIFELRTVEQVLLRARFSSPDSENAVIPVNGRSPTPSFRPVWGCNLFLACPPTTVCIIVLCFPLSVVRALHSVLRRFYFSSRSRLASRRHI